MSDAEKATQIGQWVLELKAQERELAHLDQKIERVRLAYRTFAYEWQRWRVNASDASHLFLQHPSAEERDLETHLLSQAALAKLVAERAAAAALVSGTQARLASVGITGL
jgi:hypothetical protein